MAKTKQKNPTVHRDCFLAYYIAYSYSHLPQMVLLCEQGKMPGFHAGANQKSAVKTEGEWLKMKNEIQ